MSTLYEARIELQGIQHLHATISGHEEIVRLFLELGANVTENTVKAAVEGSSLTIFCLLFEKL